MLISLVYLVPDKREKVNKDIKNNLTAVCISSMAAFIVSVLWL